MKLVYFNILKVEKRYVLQQESDLQLQFQGTKENFTLY